LARITAAAAAAAHNPAAMSPDDPSKPLAPDDPAAPTPAAPQDSSEGLAPKQTPATGPFATTTPASAAAQASPPQQAGVARRRGTARRALQVAMLALVTLPIGLAALVYGALHSARATPWVLQAFPGVPGIIQWTVQEPQGALLGADFSAAQVQVDVPVAGVRVTVVQPRWQGARWRWWLRAGVWAGVQVDRVEAQRVHVEVASDPHTPATPPRSLRLPIEVQAASVWAGEVQLNGHLAWEDISGAAHLGADGGGRHRFEDVRFGVDRLQAWGRGEIASDAPFDLTLALDGRGTGDTAWTAQARAGGPLDSFRVDGTVRAPGPSGTELPALDAGFEIRPWAGWPLGALTLKAQGLDLSTLSRALPQTALSGEAQVVTSGTRAALSARVRMDNAAPGPLDRGALPVRRMDVTLDTDPALPDVLHLQRLDLDLGNRPDKGETRGHWRGSGRWDARTLQLDGVLEALQLGQIDTRAPAARLSGPVRLELRGIHWRGADATSGDRQIGLDLQARLQGAFEGIGQPAAFEVDASLADSRIALRRLLVTAGVGRAQLEGVLEGDARQGWRLRSTGELTQVDPLPWIPVDVGPWRRGPHRLTGQWRMDLTVPAHAGSWPRLRLLQSLQGSGAVTLAPSTLAGLPVQGRVEIGQDPRAPAAQRSRVTGEMTVAGNRLRLQGQGDPAGAGQDDRWQIEVDAARLAGLSPLAPLLAAQTSLAAWLPTAGQARGQVQAVGRWPQLRTEGEIRLEGVRATAGSVAGAQARWRLDTGGDQPIGLTLQVEAARSQVLRIDRLEAQVTGRASAHRATVELEVPAGPSAALAPWLGVASGTGSRARLALAGGWSTMVSGGGRWSGTVEALEVGPNAAPAPTTSAVRTSIALMPPGDVWLETRNVRSTLAVDADGRLVAAEAGPGSAALARGLSARWDGARYVADGEQGRFEIDARIDPFAVAPWLQEIDQGLQWSGDLRARADLRLRAARTTEATLRLRRDGGDLRVTEDGNTVELGIEEMDLALDVRDGRWSLVPLVVGRALGTVSGAVTVRTTPQARWPGPQSAMDGALRMEIADLGLWAGLTPPGWRLDGMMEGTVRVGGRFGAPEFTGRLQARRLAVRNLLEGVAFTDGELAIALSGETARVERLLLRAGDGTLQGSGMASLGAQPRAQLDLRAERFRLLGRIDRQLVASGQARLALAPGQVQLSGRVGVDSGLFDIAARDAPTLDTDVRVAGAAPGAVPGPTNSTPPPGSPTPPAGTWQRVALSLDLSLGDQLRLRGRGLDTLLKGDLKLSTPAGRLNIDGTVRADQGSYIAYGQKLEIERGVLVFTGRPENPRLDVLALRPNTDMRVGVSITGTPLSPRVRLYSEPDMGETDKLSWLVLGRGAEGLGRTDTTVLQRAALALLAGDVEVPTDALMRTIGLDELTFSQSSGEVRDTVVTLGKQLSRNWYAGYERSVNATAGTWQLVYRVAQRFTLRAQSGQERSVDLIWTWQFDRARPISPADKPAADSPAAGNVR
jgi:translocation and assembly module TamB